MPLNLPKAILLDLDDTLLSFSRLREDYWNTVTRNFSGEIGGIDYRTLSSEILKKGDWFWGDNGRNKKWRLYLREARRQIVELAFESLGIGDNGLANRIADEFSDLREKGENMISPVEGSIETLNFFKDRGVKLALLTNGTSKSQRSKIEKFNLEKLFDHILIEEEVGFGKPDDGIYLEALNRLGVEGKDTWMIGDNPLWDVIAPQKFGISGIWINSKDLEEPGNLNPILKIKKLAEIRLHVH